MKQPTLRFRSLDSDLAAINDEVHTLVYRSICIFDVLTENEQ